MGAKYVSQKPDGYLKTRNNIYLDRGEKLTDRTFSEQRALDDLPPQSKANYGKEDYRLNPNDLK